MTRKFRITVNGETYEVEVEDLGGDAPVRRAAAPAPAVQKAAPVDLPKPKQAQPVAAAPAAAKPAAPAAAGAGSITAPMPGTVLDIKVNVGDQVKAGSVVLVLEAMKMENDIVAPADGTVKAVHVSKGAAVNPGDALVTIG